MSQIAKTAPKAQNLTGLDQFGTGVAQLGELTRLWRARRRSRIALSLLDARLLDDIGIDSMSRDEEIGRPFWR